MAKGDQSHPVQRPAPGGPPLPFQDRASRREVQQGIQQRAFPSLAPRHRHAPIYSRCQSKAAPPPVRDEEAMRPGWFNVPTPTDQMLPEADPCLLCIRPYGRARELTVNPVQPAAGTAPTGAADTAPSGCDARPARASGTRSTSRSLCTAVCAPLPYRIWMSSPRGSRRRSANCGTGYLRLPRGLEYRAQSWSGGWDGGEVSAGTGVTRDVESHHLVLVHGVSGHRAAVP